jgi:hypothetical protein
MVAILSEVGIMGKSADGPVRTDRREFLGQVSAGLAAGVILAQSAGGEASSQPKPLAVPTIQLGKHRISRLVVGSNPILGYSYLGHHMDQHMREYFTPERAVDLFRRCLQEGINTHQFSPSDKTTEVLRACRQSGLAMQFICLSSGREQVKDTAEKLQPFAMAHHGGVTDKLFAEGKSREVHEYVKEVHDRGMLAGVSAHNPDCIRRIVEEGWEVDFFMTCFYFLTRKMFPKVAPQAQTDTLQIDYPFFRADPSAMTEVIRQVKQPCLAFKILAAGRLCADQQTVQDAFRFAFQNIKPTDGVIVGMYPRFFDEVQANAQYVRRFGSLAPGA